jgi:hypothetical protein
MLYKEIIDFFSPENQVEHINAEILMLMKVVKTAVTLCSKAVFLNCWSADQYKSIENL